MGYGVVLPLLPYLTQRLLGPTGDAVQVSRATGLLTGLYTLSLFLFAPTWGRISARPGRRSILLVGLIGFGATMSIFAFIENLPAVYAERFVGGVFAAAVTPVALATVGDLRRQKRRGRAASLSSWRESAGFFSDPCWVSSFLGAQPTCSLPSARPERSPSR